MEAKLGHNLKYWNVLIGLELPRTNEYGELLSYVPEENKAARLVLPFLLSQTKTILNVEAYDEMLINLSQVDVALHQVDELTLAWLHKAADDIRQIFINSPEISNVFVAWKEFFEDEWARRYKIAPIAVDGSLPGNFPGKLLITSPHMEELEAEETLPWWSWRRLVKFLER